MQPYGFPAIIHIGNSFIHKQRKKHGENGNCGTIIIHITFPQF